MRDYNIIPGPETPTFPTAATPSVSNDTITKGYADTNYGSFGANASGTKASPSLITALGGITPTAKQRQIIYIKGSGGAVDVTANPQIVAGTLTNQELLLIGTDDTNTVKLEHGTGLSMNGPHTMGLDDSLWFIWDGTNWLEVARREN